MFTEMKTESFDLNSQVFERIEDKMEIRLPEKQVHKAEVTEDMLMERLHTAERAVGKFFNLPEVPMAKGDSISVELHDLKTATDDRLLYNLNQFRSMGCLSFADMTKILAHEYGHRMLQNEGIGQWAGELGGDYLSGALAEMLGLPSSNIEPLLRQQEPSLSHPGGDLRAEATVYGHEVVNDMMQQGIHPTLENYLEKFLESGYSRIEGPDGMDSAETAREESGRSFQEGTENKKEVVDDPDFWEKEAKRHEGRAEWEEKFAKEAEFRDDSKAAREHARKAEQERNKAKECRADAERHRRAQRGKKENGFSR